MYRFKVIIQGKLFQRCTHLLYTAEYCLWCKHKADVCTAWHDPSFTLKIYEIFWSLETIMWIIKFFKIQYFSPPRILDQHWCIYSCLQNPLRENWFQHVRRVYATVINFPCIITLYRLTLFLVPVAFGIILTVGLVGNILVIAVVSYYKLV